VTIKIKAPKAWGHEFSNRATETQDSTFLFTKHVRIVRESDWRKLMKLVRAAESQHDTLCLCATCKAVDALKARGGA
jgi:hypothetical protein